MTSVVCLWKSCCSENPRLVTEKANLKQCQSPTSAYSTTAEKYVKENVVTYDFICVKIIF